MNSNKCKALHDWIAEKGFYHINDNGKQLVLAALERQTQKPLGENFECPNCGEIVGDGLFCEWCGQALLFDT